MPIRILIRTTVVPIRGVISMTVVRIRILIGMTLVRIASAKNPKQILLRTIVSERAFFCKQLSPGILLRFFQKLFVFPNICIYMHIFKPRTRFTTSNEVVYLNPDLHWACLYPLFLQNEPTGGFQVLQFRLPAQEASVNILIRTTVHYFHVIFANDTKR